MGNGQKLWRGGDFDFAGFDRFKNAGEQADADAMDELSISKPSSRISRSISRPSVWRCEFQQLEKEYINKKPSA
jgi:hypothetical protein